MLHLAIYILILLFACYFQAITGFGQGLIIAPVVLVLFSKYSALSTLMIIGLGLNAYMAIKVKAKNDISLIKVLFIGCLIGLPLGLIILKAVSLASLQIIVGCTSITAVLLFVFTKVRIPKSKTYLALAGVASGAMQTATGLAGPPVVVVLNAQSTPKQIMRKALPTYFLAVGIVGALIYLFSGVFTINGVIIGLLSLPFVILAGYFGNRHGHNLPEKYYRFLVVVGVLSTGFYVIYQGLSKIIY